MHVRRGIRGNFSNHPDAMTKTSTRETVNLVQWNSGADVHRVDAPDSQLELRRPRPGREALPPSSDWRPRHWPSSAAELCQPAPQAPPQEGRKRRRTAAAAWRSVPGSPSHVLVVADRGFDARKRRGVRAAFVAADGDLQRRWLKYYRPSLDPNRADSGRAGRSRELRAERGPVLLRVRSERAVAA